MSKPTIMKKRKLAFDLRMYSLIALNKIEKILNELNNDDDQMMLDEICIIMDEWTYKKYLLKEIK